MEYREVIKRKNKILSIALLMSIVLRCIVNAVFIGVESIVVLGVAGLLAGGLLLILSYKINPLIMMYLMVVFLTGISAVFMYIFYGQYTQQLADTWSVDAMAMCIVYIVSALFVFWSLCRLTGQQFDSLKKSSEESNAAREKAEK